MGKNLYEEELFIFIRLSFYLKRNTVFQPSQFITLLYVMSVSCNNDIQISILIHLKTKYYRVPSDADNLYCKKSQPSTSTETGSLQILISHNQGQWSVGTGSIHAIIIKTL